MNPLMLWRRLQPLLSFFLGLLGVEGMLKMLFSGLAISLIELGGLALIFPFSSSLPIWTSISASCSGRQIHRWSVCCKSISSPCSPWA